MSDEAMLLTDAPADGVRRFTLNRPDKRNALSTPLLLQLAEALETADVADGVRCMIVTGGEKVFAAGADVNEIAAKDGAGALADPRPPIWARIRNIGKPIIAAVEGWCLGAGNELMMCCDLAVASEAAKFGQPETSLGIMPGAGGAAVLARRVGRARAMRMVLTGEPLTADEALQAGLIAETTATGAANERALELAVAIAARAPLAMREAKAVVRSAEEMPLTAGLAFERQAFAFLLSTEDKTEGVNAFLEKRPPQWRGR